MYNTQTNSKNVKRLNICAAFIIILLLPPLLLASCASSSVLSQEKATPKDSVKIADTNKSNFININTVESLSEKHRKIDLEIEAASKDKNNTFENPLIIQDPFDISPLTAVAAFYTEKNVAIRMTIVGDTRPDTLVHDFPAAKLHRIPIIGLYSNRENTVILEQIISGQVKLKKELKIKTEPLPSKLGKNVEVTLSKSKSEAVSGITVVSGLHSKIPYAFDSSGNIRWFLKVTTESYGYFPMSNGRFMLMNTSGMIPTKIKPYSTELYDMDFLGRVHSIYLVANGAHHEVKEKTPNGNLLVLSNSLYNHEEDLVVEIDRSSGKIVKSLCLGNIIKNTYDKPYDWAHINSISYNPRENSMILSSRNISSAVKVNWSNDKLVWILSDPAIWRNTPYEKYVLKPVGPTIWHYEQHAVYQMPEDLDNNPKTLDIMMFDNRSFEILPVKLNVSTEIGTSAVAQYSIDEKNGTVKQLKRFSNVHSSITSNFSLFKEKDRLIAYHGTVGESKTQWGEIFEYQYSTGKLLRTYKTSNTFYRGYRQDFDYEAANKPMEMEVESTNNFIKGDLTPLVKIKNDVETPKFKAPEEMSYLISGNLLYIYMRYSLVSKVEFVGTNGTWTTNLISDSSKNLKAGDFKKQAGNKLSQLPNSSSLSKYNLVLQLKYLPKGTYTLNLEYCGIYVSTGTVVQIR